MRHLNRQSALILLLGPIFLILFLALNIQSVDYRTTIMPSESDPDTLFITSNHAGDQPRGFMIEPWMMHRIDTSDQLTFDQVRNSLNQFASYTDLDHTAPGAGVIWHHLTAKSGSKVSTWYLTTTALKTQYYYRINDGSWQTDIAGTHKSQPDRNFPFIFTPLASIEIPANSTLELFMKCSKVSAGSLGSNQLWRLDHTLANASFIYQFHIERLWEVVPVLAILFSVFLYHLVLFLFNQNRTYLWLSLSALVYSFLLSIDSDLLIRLAGFNNLGIFRDYALGLPHALLIVVVPLSIYYLKIHKHSKTWWLLFYSSIIYIAFWITVKIMYHTMEAYPTKALFWISVWVMAAMNLLILSIIIRQILRKNPFAISFFAGYGTVLAGSIATMMMALDYLPITNHYLPIAAGFLLFSIGLAQEYRTIQVNQLKTEQQRSLLEHKHDMEMQEKKRLKELNKYKSKLYTNFTHEFRTPLTVIKGVTENIKDHHVEKNLIQRNATTLLNLVNSMLDLNKIDSGRLHPTWIQTDIIPFIKYLAESIEYLTTSKNIDFKVESLHESLWMDTDISFLQTIVINLLHNAIKYTPINGEIRMRIIKENASNCCHIRISDSGSGISQEDLDKIFDRFFQTNNHQRNIEGGTGIGLAIVKELTNLLNGKITVESRIHEGSTFTVMLPITQNASVQDWNKGEMRTASPEEEKKYGIEFSHKKVQILIVEDSVDIRTYLTMLLSDDFHILTASNGREGLNKATHEIPDIIISDIMMPEMDGIEFCQMVKNDKRTSHIPVIILTAKSTQKDRLAGLYEGADAYLVKPFDKRELLIRINKLLENQQKIRKHYQQFGTLPVEKNIENKFVRAIHEHISTNLHSETYQIEDLVTHLHLSRTQIYRKLKALTGRTFTEILKDQRMAKAQQLLISSDQKIAEIAFEVGYREPAYFSKVFKSETKLTPLQFRLRNI